uniref:Uncharacterized protein n=1 Tax=Eutreptiella gymnastica TaxID=73025 RepID=A0A7S1JDN4_9EUGL|mmetsp:Transcript_88184/g.153200  ORF Transcript_88184/g.153200 Transcript_88184/m.153200 type:complete len:127 (+) Transcript_88184:318-698(+)
MPSTNLLGDCLTTFWHLSIHGLLTLNQNCLCAQFGCEHDGICAFVTQFNVLLAVPNFESQMLAILVVLHMIVKRKTVNCLSCLSPNTVVSSSPLQMSLPVPLPPAKFFMSFLIHAVHKLSPSTVAD